MAYIAPTPSDFRNRFAPVFDATNDDVINRALTSAARMVDESWTEGDFAEARMLLAAHELTTEGVGASAAAQEVLSGAAIKSRAAGDHKIEFQKGVPGLLVGSAEAGEFGATLWGIKFWRLLKQNRGGPRVSGSGLGGYSSAATDWPFPQG